MDSGSGLQQRGHESVCRPLRLLLPLPHVPLLLLQSPLQERETTLLPPPSLIRIAGPVCSIQDRAGSHRLRLDQAR